MPSLYKIPAQTKWLKTFASEDMKKKRIVFFQHARVFQGH